MMSGCERIPHRELPVRDSRKETQIQHPVGPQHYEPSILDSYPRHENAAQDQPQCRLFQTFQPSSRLSNLGQRLFPASS